MTRAREQQSERMQPCPICGQDVPASERYPRYACDTCVAQATSRDGRPVSFGNINMSGGVDGCYADTREPYASHACWIRGVPCVADEARFGGIVIEPMMLEIQLRRKCSTVKLELDLTNLWYLFDLLIAHGQVELVQRYLTQLHNEEFWDENEVAQIAAHYQITPPRLF